MTFEANQSEFEYHTENGQQFLKDFVGFVKTDVPLFALQDELLYLMDQRQSTRFRIPDYRCLDGREHTFYFELCQIKEKPRHKVYRYLGMDLN